MFFPQGLLPDLRDNCNKKLRKFAVVGAWLAQSVEHVTLDLRVVGSRPTLGIEIA